MVSCLNCWGACGSARIARMEAGWDQEVARAFGARGGEDRRLELEEPLLFHPSAERINDLPAQHDVLVQLLAAQVEETVSEPRVLGIGLVAEHRQRQVAGRAENFDLTHVDLDEAGRHLWVFGAGGRLRTLPSTRMTNSERSFSASAKAGESGSTTHWVRP